MDGSSSAIWKVTSGCCRSDHIYLNILVSTPISGLSDLNRPLLCTRTSVNLINTEFVEVIIFRSYLSFVNNS